MATLPLGRVTEVVASLFDDGADGDIVKTAMRPLGRVAEVTEALVSGWLAGIVVTMMLPFGKVMVLDEELATI